MKRPLLTILLGLIAGLAVHFVYYGWHQRSGPETLEGKLAWIRAELQLSDSQFARIRELHQASHPRLQLMAAQVAQMHAEFTEFERARRTSDRIDFLEFARFVETRRELNRECLDSTRQLVLASAEVMTPEQRERYIRLVATAEPVMGALMN